MIAHARAQHRRSRSAPAVTHQAFYEFQVFFKCRMENEEFGMSDSDRLKPEQRTESMLVRMETSAQARAFVEGVLPHGQCVVGVGPGRPIVDWGKPYLLRSEVESFACCGSTAITEAIAKGKLKACAGRHLFKREDVVRWLEGASTGANRGNGD